MAESEPNTRINYLYISPNQSVELMTPTPLVPVTNDFSPV